MTGDPQEVRLVEMRFDAKPETLKRIRDAVREAAARCGFDVDGVHDCVVAVDEACQNIIRHGYGNGGGEVILEILRNGDEVIFLLRDFAEKIDQRRIKPRDLEDLRPGGLGTHFMREMMDEVVYLSPPEGRGNLLRMVKRIK